MINILQLLISLLLVSCFSKVDLENNLSLEENFIEQVKLSRKLNEISGMCYSKDGRLFAHQDETGIIFELDQSSGNIIKQWQVGLSKIKGDFEGLATVNGKFFLIESNGVIYEFKEGEDKHRVIFKKHELGFSSKFEIEGLCYDQLTNSLLILCKNYPGKKYRGYRAVYECSLDNFRVNIIPRYLISLSKLSKEYGVNSFFPSGIEKLEKQNYYFIISSKGKPSYVIINSNNELVDAGKLKSKRHKQPEGITICNDSTIVISDEAVGGKATLSFYKLPNF